MAPSIDIHSTASHPSSTSSSLSTPPTSLNSNSHVSHVPSAKPYRRASNSAFADGLFSKDLPSFLRSNSKLRRESPTLSPQVEESQDQKFVSPDYAQDQFRLPRDQDQLDLLQMLRGKDSEKPTKKSENRFYGFFGRSPSRSRSKKRRSRSADAFPIIDVPLPAEPSSSTSHIRHSSFDNEENANTHLHDLKSSKPTAISPSRPLSSTTTVTNGTITQSKFREKKRVDQVHAVHITHAPDVPTHDCEIDEHVKPRKRTIFGIPIPSPRTTSFSRSRPNTPKLPPDQHQQRKLDRSFSAPSRAHDASPHVNHSTHLHSSDDIPALPKPSSLHSKPDSGLGSETVNTSSKSKIFAPLARPTHGAAPTNLQDIIPNIPRRSSSSPPRLEKRGSPSTSKPPHNPQACSGRNSPLFGLFKGKERGSGSRVASPISVHEERVDLLRREASCTGRTIVSISAPKIPKGRSKHGSFDFERPTSSSVGSRGGFKSTSSSRIASGSETGKVLPDGHWQTRSTTYVIQEERSSLTRSHSARSSSTQKPVDARIRFEDPPVSRSGHTSTNGSSHSHTRLPSLHVLKTKAVSPKAEVTFLPPRTDTAATGQSSSLGRSNSKRIPPGGGIHGAHPAFSFEPAMAPKTDKFGPGRATGRGRSLDLGIELNWAPTRLKEEAVMRTRTKWRDEAEVKENGRSQVAESFEQVLGENGYAKFREYVHRFDARLMPLDGPSGLMHKVQRLLETTARGLDQKTKRELLERFDHVVQQNR